MSFLEDIRKNIKSRYLSTACATSLMLSNFVGSVSSLVTSVPAAGKAVLASTGALALSGCGGGSGEVNDYSASEAEVSAFLGGNVSLLTQDFINRLFINPYPLANSPQDIRERIYYQLVNNYKMPDSTLISELETSQNNGLSAIRDSSAFADAEINWDTYSIRDKMDFIERISDVCANANNNDISIYVTYNDRDFKPGEYNIDVNGYMGVNFDGLSLNAVVDLSLEAHNRVAYRRGYITSDNLWVIYDQAKGDYAHGSILEFNLEALRLGHKDDVANLNGRLLDISKDANDFDGVALGEYFRRAIAINGYTNTNTEILEHISRYNGFIDNSNLNNLIPRDVVLGLTNTANLQLFENQLRAGGPDHSDKAFYGISVDGSLFDLSGNLDFSGSLLDGCSFENWVSNSVDFRDGVMKNTAVEFSIWGSMESNGNTSFENNYFNRFYIGGQQQLSSALSASALKLLEESDKLAAERKAFYQSLENSGRRYPAMPHQGPSF